MNHLFLTTVTQFGCVTLTLGMISAILNKNRFDAYLSLAVSIIICGIATLIYLAILGAVLVFRGETLGVGILLVWMFTIIFRERSKRIEEDDK